MKTFRKPQSYTRGPAGAWNVYCPYCSQEMQFSDAQMAVKAGLDHAAVCPDE